MNNTMSNARSRSKEHYFPDYFRNYYLFYSIISITLSTYQLLIINIKTINLLHSSTMNTMKEFRSNNQIQHPKAALVSAIGKLSA